MATRTAVAQHARRIGCSGHAAGATGATASGCPTTTVPVNPASLRATSIQGIITRRR